MLGVKASAPQTEGWYVVAKDGGLVMRVRPGMQVGEDPAGELSFEPADARLEFYIALDGTLVLLAGADYEIEVSSGQRTRSFDAGRESQIQIRLIDNVLSVATDFLGDPLPGEPLEVRVLPIGGIEEPAAPAPDVASPARTEVILLPEPLGEIFPSSRWQRSRAIRMAASALGSVAVLMLSYLVFQPQVDSVPLAEPGVPPTQVVERREPATASSGLAPSVAGLLGSVAALLDAEALPGESARGVALESLKASIAAYPGNATVRQRLEELTERLADDAMLKHDAGDADLALRLVEQASTTGVAQQQVATARAYLARPAPAATFEVTPVSLPSIPYRSIPVDPPDPIEQPDPVAEPPARVESTELASFSIDLNQIGQVVQAMTNERAIDRDLRDAAEALERGSLMTPPGENAFTLYSRVLTAEPESLIARMGLQSVRDRLLARARIALASDDAGTAMTALDDAARAGADHAVVAELRATARYRQSLLDALAGKPGSLYPITELTAIRQDPPDYPRHAPAGAEGSVDVEMNVTPSGRVRDVEVLGDPPMYFVRAARHAVGEWRFAPVLHEGRPVPVRTSVKVTFRRD